MSAAHDIETVDIQGAAQLLYCHKQTVLKLARAGEIRGRKVGRAWVFVRQDLIDYIRQGDDERPCQSEEEKAAPTGTSASPRQTDSEYNTLLGLPTSGKPKNTRPHLKAVSGGKSS